MGDISNSKLAKIFSIEALSGVLVGAFMVGVAYAQLSAEVGHIRKEQDLVNAEIRKILDEMSTTKTNVGLMQKDVGYLQKDFERMVDLLEIRVTAGGGPR